MFLDHFEVELGARSLISLERAVSKTDCIWPSGEMVLMEVGGGTLGVRASNTHKLGASCCACCAFTSDLNFEGA